MKVVTNDYRFATTNVAGIYHPYASAADCKSYGCTNSRSGTFKVDLSGTSFRLPSTISYKTNAYPSCAKKLFSPTMDIARLRWSAKCGGRYSRCTPKYLNLELNGWLTLSFTKRMVSLFIAGMMASKTCNNRLLENIWQKYTFLRSISGNLKFTVRFRTS